MTGTTVTSHAALLEALETIRSARAQVEALGFEASTVDLHGVPRAVFDRLPGTEEHGHFSGHDPYWSKRVDGVNVYCDEPHVPVAAGERVLS